MKKPLKIALGVPALLLAIVAPFDAQSPVPSRRNADRPWARGGFFARRPGMTKSSHGQGLY